MYIPKTIILISLFARFLQIRTYGVTVVRHAVFLTKDTCAVAGW